MAVDKKDRIFVGDAMVFVYETRFSDESLYTTPTTPVSAIARVWSQQDQGFLDIGGTPDPTIADVEVTPETPETGALLKYILDETVTVAPGNYTVYITASFSDGSVLTENRSIRVLDFR